MPTDLIRLAGRNLSSLTRNRYPGRGIIVGMSDDGSHLVQVYWIMGRSANSRNRIFKTDCATRRVFTEPADAAAMQDPSLVIYNAMRERGRYFVVSNGDQTDTVIGQQEPIDLAPALSERVYEPDEPNFTQRITALCSIEDDGAVLQLAVLRKSIFDTSCNRAFYQYRPHPGYGYCVTTYAGDGNPLPHFRGDPWLMPLNGSESEITRRYWDALNPDNRVSLAVKFIEIETRTSHVRIINKYAKVGADVQTQAA